jgi:hypothetical protein
MKYRWRRLFTASFFDKQMHRGDCYSIAYSQPKSKGGQHKVVKPLVPPWRFVSALHKGVIDEQKYTRLYNHHVLRKTSPINISALLDLLGCGKEVTLLCWEDEDDFCHRKLVAAWLLRSGLFRRGVIA